MTLLHADEQAPSHAQQSAGRPGSYSQGTKLILGVDPGIYGALALYAPSTQALSILDVPTHNVGKGKVKKITVDEYALARAIDDSADKIDAVFLEHVWSRPGEGAAGAFTFGKVYGILRGICAANFLPIHDVTPQTWKGALKVMGDKDHARQRASALLPRSAHLWPLKKHDGRAEAALIALYGAQRLAAVGAAQPMGQAHDEP